MIKKVVIFDYKKESSRLFFYFEDPRMRFQNGDIFSGIVLDNSKRITQMDKEGKNFVVHEKKYWKNIIKGRITGINILMKMHEKNIKLL